MHENLFSLKFIQGLSLATLAWASGIAHAGRPLVVEDASILEHQACQLETWGQKFRQGSEYWVVPACNFTGNLELALGAARIHLPQERQTAILLQAKTLFKPLETNGWGVGLVLGDQFNPSRSVSGDVYASIPVSFSFRDDAVLLHTNLGWLREKESGRHSMTWGIATEAQFAERSWLSLETFGRHQGKPFYQVGLRHWIVPERVQVDSTYGDRFGAGSEERWFSIGLKFVFTSLLP